MICVSLGLGLSKDLCFTETKLKKTERDGRGKDIIYLVEKSETCSCRAKSGATCDSVQWRNIGDIKLHVQDSRTQYNSSIGALNNRKELSLRPINQYSGVTRLSLARFAGGTRISRRLVSPLRSLSDSRDPRCLRPRTRRWTSDAEQIRKRQGIQTFWNGMFLLGNDNGSPFYRVLWAFSF